MRKHFLTSMGLVVLMAGAGAVRADDDDHDNDRDDRQPPAASAALMESQVVRVADIGGLGPLFSPNGTDPLMRGRIAVGANREVEIHLAGAAPNDSYSLFFCRFGFGPPCMSLSASLSTNNQGNVDARLSFPATTGALAGSFVFTRAGANQFVSGFSFPAAPPAPMGVEVELKGTITSINAANSSFQLDNFGVDIVVNSATRLQRADTFADLRMGQRVEVRGFTMGSLIIATRVTVEDRD